MISAILFDLDGVLVDACEWHYESLNQAMMEVVGYSISRKDHEERFNGIPTKSKLIQLGISGLNFDKINELKQKYVLRLINEQSVIDPKRIQFLNILKTKNIRLACVTNSIKQTAVEMLIRSGQYEFMDLVLSNEDVLNNKPHPEPYNKAINLLGADPKTTVIVEDSIKGFESAIRCECSLIWKIDNSKELTFENFTRIFNI